MVVQGKHDCTVEHLMTEQRLKIHVARMRSYADACLDMTEEIREVIARIRRQGDPRTANEIDSGRFDDVSYNVGVE